MNVLLVFGHPRKDSLGGALYQAFRAGLTAAGVAHRELVLADLDFNPDVHEVSPSDQWLEADIRCQSRGTPCRAAVMAANRLMRRKPLPARIDALIALALTFMIWFGVISLVRLL